MFLLQVLTSIGNFCICSIAVGMILEIIVMFPIQKRSYRDGINNLLVLLIGGIPIAMPTVLSVTLAIGSHRLSQQVQTFPMDLTYPNKILTFKIVLIFTKEQKKFNFVLSSINKHSIKLKYQCLDCLKCYFHFWRVPLQKGWQQLKRWLEWMSFAAIKLELLHWTAWLLIGTLSRYQIWLWERFPAIRLANEPIVIDT